MIKPPQSSRPSAASQILAFGLQKRLGNADVLQGVDLALEGGVTTILGPNGAGKTSLIRCLATVMRVDAGSLLIDGLDPVHESDRVEIRRRLGYLPQEAGLATSARVFDVVEYLAVLKDIGHNHPDPRRARRQAVVAVLDQVGLGDRIGDQVGELSGGMRRRVGLAQALLGSPSLLLLDEPSAALDPDERLRLRSLVAELRHRTTIVQSSHLTDEAATSDQVLVMDEGRVIFVGSPAALASSAMGRAWIQETAPHSTRASWRLADGSYRCLGDPPPNAKLVEPTIEDGYLLLRGSPVQTG